MSFTCVSCKAIEPYLTADYLNTLASKAGLGDGLNSEQSLSELISWGVVNKDENINEFLKYDFLASTINNLIESEDKGINNLKDKGWIKRSKKEEDLVDKEDALEIIDKAVDSINSKTFDTKFSLKEKYDTSYLNNYRCEDNNLVTENELNIGEYIYLEDENIYKKVVGFYNGQYILEDVSFEEIIESLEIEDSYKLDLSNSIDTPGEVSLEYENNDLYVNNGKNLLASKTKSFNSNGFRVSYKINTSGIEARISKNVNGLNMFFDVSISNIKPSYKWNYKDGKVESAYFKVDFKSVEEIGASIGRYKNYYLDLKDKDSSSFVNLAKSIIKKSNDEVEATVKICEIKTPIPQMPLLFLNIEVLAKIYTSGKMEIVLSNSNTKGFEVKNGLFRIISDDDRDINFKVGGSAKSALGLNFNLEAVKYRLMDIEVDAGIKASMYTTMHLYDSDGNKTEETTDLTYSSLDELSNENNDVKVCGDVSLNWLLDVKLNTSKTLLYKFGLSKDFEILDEKNQVLGNKTHIENFTFVSKCTRKDRLKSTNNTTETLNVDKILLDKYSKVLKLNEEYSVNIKNLPSGYTVNDLVYSSEKKEVAIIDTNGVIKALSKGASEIKISTSDGKYSSSINILVSSN